MATGLLITEVHYKQSIERRVLWARRKSLVEMQASQSDLEFNVPTNTIFTPDWYWTPKQYRKIHKLNSKQCEIQQNKTTISVTCYNTQPGNKMCLFYNAPEPTRGFQPKPDTDTNVITQHVDKLWQQHVYRLKKWKMSLQHVSWTDDKRNCKHLKRVKWYEKDEHIPTDNSMDIQTDTHTNTALTFTDSLKCMISTSKHVCVPQTNSLILMSCLQLANKHVCVCIRQQVNLLQELFQLH